MQENEQRGSTKLALKAGFWYVFSTFLIKGLSFITTPIFARLLSKEDYGEFSNFASWQVLLLIITGAELHNTLARAYFDYKDDYDKYVSTVTIAACGVTLVFYIFFLLNSNWILNIVSIPEEFIHILFFMLMFQACKQIYMARERTLYRYKSVAAISIVNLLIPTIIAVILVILADEMSRLPARIYGFYIPSAVIGLGCALVIILRGRSFKWEYCRYAFALSLPLMIHYLTAHILTSSNTIVTKWVLGAEAVSTVSIASSTNHILTILLQAVSGAVTVWLMDNMEQGNLNITRKGTLIYAVGISAIGVAVILLAPEFVWLLGGTAYADSVALMPGMVAATLIQSITTIFTIILTYEKKVVRTALYTGLVSIFCVLAKYFLLSYMGVIVLPYINMVSFGILFVVNYLLVKKYGCSKYISIKGLTCIIGGVCIISLVSLLTYENIVIRASLIAIFAITAVIVAYLNRSLIIKVVKNKFKKRKISKESKEKMEESDGN